MNRSILMLALVAALGLSACERQPDRRHRSRPGCRARPRRSAGRTRCQGNTGYTGQTGAQGETGYTGQTGAQGDTGYTGQPGETGQTGETGKTGPGTTVIVEPSPAPQTN